MPKKEININPDELDYGTDFVGENETNPLYANMFNQPATVNADDSEYRVVPRNKLHAFPNHPYKVTVDEEMLDLRDSIIDNGILHPLIVRPRADGDYEIISGHRRCKAAELAQLSDVPVIIKKSIDDATATILMVDSNKQRELILPSERAFAYKMKMEAMSRQGRRTDLNNELVDPGSTSENLVSQGHEVAQTTSAPRGRKLESREILAQEEGVGKNTISRYIRLTHLIPQLRDLVDNDALKQSPSMALKPAVEISYLNTNEQKYFYDTVKALDKTPSVQQATQIKRLSQDGLLTQTDVMNILMADKPNQKETVKMDYERLGGYFNGRLTPKECEKAVFESLDSLNKIRASVDRHIKGTITDDELATLVENLLKEYSKSQNKGNRTQER